MANPQYARLFPQLTIYELLTYEEVYVASRDKKSLATLSKESGRDISGYTRAIDRLNDIAKNNFGEHLMLKAFQKGTPWTPTQTGRMFYDFCCSIHACLDQHIQQMGRLSLPRPVRIAMPQLPLHEMLRIEDHINSEYRRVGKKFEKQLIHIRSEQLPTILLNQSDIDFAFGGLIEPEALDQSLEFVEIEQRRYNLISNYDFAGEHDLEQNAELSIEFLQRHKVPLLIAHTGVIVDCLLKTLGVTRQRHEDLTRYLELIRERYNIVEECNDVHFMIELLCTSRLNLSMFGTKDIFSRSRDRARSQDVVEFCASRGTSAPMMYYQTVSADLPPLRVGVIRRRPADSSVPFSNDHPYYRFWRACMDFAEKANVLG